MIPKDLGSTPLMIPKGLPSSPDFMGLPLVFGIERVVVFGYLGFGLG